MALIKCPECGNQISDKAESCPHCGLPANNYKKPPDKPIRTNSGFRKLRQIVKQIAQTEIFSQHEHNNKRIVEPTHDSQPLDGFNAKEFRNVLVSFDQDYERLFLPEYYIDGSKADNFKSFYQPYYLLTLNDLVFQYMKTNRISLQIDVGGFNRFRNSMQHLEADIEHHNTAYIDAKLAELKDYFDHIMDDIDPEIHLDEEQRRAILTDENHCLIVAGAGAGKTTTMAAKVKYLVDKQNVPPQDIIVISYTNKAIDELKERINNKLKISAKVSTFHSFAFDIIRKADSTPPELNYSSFNIVYDMLAKSIFDNKQLMKNLILFMGYYFDIPEDLFQFKNLNEYHLYKSTQLFETLKSGLDEYVKNVAHRRSKSVRTITGEYLRSTQEVQIANFLYLNGIDYEYEKPYPFPIPNARKTYTPDFYISQEDNSAYIEHFGLTDGMKSFLLNPKEVAKYQKSIIDKRAIHKLHNTKLLETWGYYSDKKPLLQHLEEILVKQGFVLKPRNLEDVYHKIVETGKDKYIYRLVIFMMRFIEQFKTIGYDEAGFEVLRKKTDNVRSQLFLDIAEQVYRHYQNTLKENNEIDFADMINNANTLLADMQSQHVDLSYKYIIIDEFQDIARQRYNLTKNLSEITHAKVVAVGDDWQSIFAFAGSDITLFTKFIDLMGSGKELKITHTYRNSQELIDIAGNFIQKNSSQIKKQLVSPKKLKDPIQLEPYEDKIKPFQNLTHAVNNCISKIISEFGVSTSILLIGRYSFDFYKMQMTGEFTELFNGKVKSKRFPEANLTYMTAHSSKGLGYDNVIIVNMLEARLGFPSQIEDDPILKMVTYEDTSMPFAEERRLFYVALTRTRNRVYIATPMYRPSRFLVELIKDYNLPHPKELNLETIDSFNLKCPNCGFPLKYQYNTNYGLDLYICTNEAEICDFMTNNRQFLQDIYKCPKCKDGYMIVKRKATEGFYGCTNYNQGQNNCRNTAPFNSIRKKNYEG
jgi:DNA helicase IV